MHRTQWAADVYLVQVQHATIHEETITPDMPGGSDTELTVLMGPVEENEATVLGAINLLYDLGLSLVSAEKMDAVAGDDLPDGPPTATQAESFR